jgi:hypothetical protein
MYSKAFNAQRSLFNTYTINFIDSYYDMTTQNIRSEDNFFIPMFKETGPRKFEISFSLNHTYLASKVRSRDVHTYVQFDKMLFF